MRLRCLLTLFLVMQLSLGNAVWAGSLKYAPAADGVKITGDATVRNVGDLSRPKSQAVFREDKLDILFSVDLTEKSSTTTTDDHLTGTNFNTKIRRTGGGGLTLTGLTYFDGGNQLPRIDKPGAEESVTTKDGHTYKCHVSEVKSGKVIIVTDSGTTKTIEGTDIDKISSPRVYTFEVPLTSSGDYADGQPLEATSKNMTFHPTYTAHLSSSTTKTVERTAEAERPKMRDGVGDGRGITKKKVLIFIAVSLLVATAIAVPIAVACGTGGHHGNGASEATQRAFVLRLLQSRSGAVADVP